MKTIFTLGISIAFTLSVKAQPSMVSSGMAASGTVITMKTATVTEIDTTIQGANKTWDFTSLQADGAEDDYMVSYMNVASTPYASNFPNANYCYKEVWGTDIHYCYFNLSSTKCERVGSQVPGNPTPNVYSDRQTEYVFPLTLGTSSHDTWASTNSSFGGNYDFECVGYGTLKLPGGQTHNDVLMVRLIMEEIVKTPVYMWYGLNGAVLLQYVDGDDFFMPILVRYTSSITTTAVEEKISNTSVFCKNPVREELSLTINQQQPTDLQYSIINTLGETVKAGNIEKLTKSIGIDMSDLKSGIYYFTATGANETIKTIKLLKL